MQAISRQIRILKVPVKCRLYVDLVVNLRHKEHDFEFWPLRCAELSRLHTFQPALHSRLLEQRCALSNGIRINTIMLWYVFIVAARYIQTWHSLISCRTSWHCRPPGSADFAKIPGMKSVTLLYVSEAVFFTTIFAPCVTSYCEIRLRMFKRVGKVSAIALEPTGSVLHFLWRTQSAESS